MPLFFPDYNWYIAIAVEYIVHFLTFAMLVLFLEMLFPGLYLRAVLWGYFALAGVFILLTCALPPEIYTGFLVVFDGVSVGMMGYTLVRLGMKLREKKLQNLLAFLGVLLVCLFGLNDMLYHNYLPSLSVLAGQSFTAPIAMLFFVFCYGLVVSLEYAETQRRMEEAHRLLAAAEARYAALQAETQAAAGAVPPLDSLGLSPREREVALLLLDGRRREDIARALGVSVGTVNTLCSRVYKKAGVTGGVGLAKRLGANGSAPPPEDAEKNSAAP